MRVKVIGGGLAGSECAYQLLKRGYDVDLYEMRGVKNTPCHSTDKLAELVCSNSLKAQSMDNASGLLKYELARLDSLILKSAYASDVPAGGALAVDRDKFSALIESRLREFGGFRLIREEVKEIDSSQPVVIATGPLTSDAMSECIAKLLGGDYLDADYLNCAMNKEQYIEFRNQLVNAERAQLKDFEINVFERCMPIEIMAGRGEDTMRYGPLRPVGIRNPHSDERPYAVVQLRKENKEGSAYNIVGFQTNLKFGEQKRVFRLIPGLENAEFARRKLCDQKISSRIFCGTDDGRRGLYGKHAQRTYRGNKSCEKTGRQGRFDNACYHCYGSFAKTRIHDSRRLSAYECKLRCFARTGQTAER